MTLAERKTNPAITTMLTKALTESEMEKTVGGTTHWLDGIISVCSWVACGFGHNYKYTGKKKNRTDLFRKFTVYERVCQECGHADWTSTAP